MKKMFLPIFILVLLTGGITYIVFSRLNQLSSTGQSPLKFGIKPSELNLGFSSLTAKPTPEPSLPAYNVNSDSITVTPTPEGTNTAGETVDSTLVTPTPIKSNLASATRTSTTVCTPVYGMADTCVEHITVDTGADTEVFFNLGALSYLGGLVAFIKAKSTKK